jgi:hypothetical protein
MPIARFLAHTSQGRVRLARDIRRRTVPLRASGGDRGGVPVIAAQHDFRKCWLPRTCPAEWQSDGIPRGRIQPKDDCQVITILVQLIFDSRRSGELFPKYDLAHIVFALFDQFPRIA